MNWVIQRSKYIFLNIFLYTFSENIFCLFVPNSKDWWTDNIMQIGSEQQKIMRTKSVCGLNDKTGLNLVLFFFIQTSLQATKLCWFETKTDPLKHKGKMKSYYCS